LSPAPKITWKLVMASGLPCRRPLVHENAAPLRPRELRPQRDEPSPGATECRPLSGKRDRHSEGCRTRWLLQGIDLVAIGRIVLRAIGEVVEYRRASRAVEVMRRHADKGAGEAAMGL